MFSYISDSMGTRVWALAMDTHTMGRQITHAHVTTVAYNSLTM